MNFLHPTLVAFGLASIALPIIIHLLVRRRVKPIRWAAMRFLMEAHKKRRKRLLIEQLLLLAARCLLVALLALAIGRLLIGDSNAGGAGSAARPTALYILIDDSLTSRADGALERHKKLAEALLGQLDPARGDSAALLTLSSPAEGVVLPPAGDLASVRRLLDALTPTDAAMDLAGAMARLGADRAAETEGVPGVRPPRVVLAILSDFLAGSADIQNPVGALEPSPDLVLISPVRAQSIDNVALVGVEPLRSVVTAGGAGVGSTNQVRITARRFGDSTGSGATVSLTALVPDDEGVLRDAGTRQVRFEPGQTEASAALALDVLPPEGATARASMVIGARLPSDALRADDVLKRVIEFRASIRVGIIAPRRFERASGIDQFDSADWAALALEPASTGPSGSGRAVGARADIDVQRVEPSAITLPRLAGFDAIVLASPQALDRAGWEAIGRFVGSGGLLVAMPQTDATVHLWADELTSALGMGWSIEREARVYDAPMRLSPERGATGPEDLLSLVAVELPELLRPVSVERVLPVGFTRDESPSVLLSLADGTPLVVGARPGEAGSRGYVVLFATPLSLSWTDLPAKPLVVPLMQEILRQGVGVARGSWVSTAGSVPVLPAGVIELRPDVDPESAESGLRSVQIGLGAGGSGFPALRRAGVYRALDERGVTRGVLTVQPPIRASDTTSIPDAVVRSWLGPIAGSGPLQTISADDVAPGSGGMLQQRDAQRDLSLWLLLGALAMALVEVGLARWSSHAGRLSPIGEGVTA